MMPWYRLLPAAAAVVCSGCLGAVEGLYPPGADESARSVYVVNHNDRHTGIVIRRGDIPDDLWPEWMSTLSPIRRHRPMTP